MVSLPVAGKNTGAKVSEKIIMPSSAQKALLPDTSVAAIIRGDYVDVFAVLGMQDYSSDQKQLSVFLPGAEEITVVSAGAGKSLLKLERLHAEGLFSGLLNRKKRVPYRLRVTYPQAQLFKEDPYRFPSLLSHSDLYLLNNGTQEQAYNFLGANHRVCESVAGILFAVWAPNARRVSVVGDFNDWDGRVHIMRKHPAAGVWEIFIPDLEPGQAYKFEIIDQQGQRLPLKADPYARQMQLRPDTASLIPVKSEFKWADDDWLRSRQSKSHHQQPVSIYEVHAGSWKRKVESGNRFLTYRELVDELIPYVVELGFTHIQFMPLSEYPFDGSWGYQPIGMFAPTSRYGNAEDFKYFVNAAHQAGLGVLLDWVPGHFPNDEHGLSRFDGTYLYEHTDPKKGFHPDWNTCIYNYGRGEVISYLLSNALYWLDEFHIDGLRFDAVASMLYLDYSRKDGEWLPNQYGGRENIEAIDLLRSITGRAYFNFPGIMLVAEESTAWPGVTDFTENGGLGFGFKWNMVWMNDTLSYLSRDPVHRKFHHNQMTFSLLYAYSENFILPLSHDEVVHGKRSLLERVPGDDWQKFASLRAYYAFMWGHPGKKLLFMGCEFAQRNEWNHDQSLDWHLLQFDSHQGLKRLVSDINHLYRKQSALFQYDTDPKGFEWLDADNYHNSIFIFARKSDTQTMVILLNMTPLVHHQYRIGVSLPGNYREVINTDSSEYGGSGKGNFGSVSSEPVPSHGREHSLNLTIPPLACLYLEYQQP